MRVPPRRLTRPLTDASRFQQTCASHAPVAANQFQSVQFRGQNGTWPTANCNALGSVCHRDVHVRIPGDRRRLTAPNVVAKASLDDFFPNNRRWVQSPFLRLQPNSSRLQAMRVEAADLVRGFVQAPPRRRDRPGAVKAAGIQCREVWRYEVPIPAQVPREY